MRWPAIRRNANALAAAFSILGLSVAVAGSSSSAIPFRLLPLTEKSQIVPIAVAMRGGGASGGSGMGGPPIIYLPPSGPSMHSPGLRSPSFHAPSPPRVGRPNANQRFNHQKNPSWKNGKRVTTSDASGRRKRGEWNKKKHGWKPVHCRDKWHCHHHRYNNRYNYAYNNYWFDDYDYYDGYVQYDDSHIRWCKKRYRSYSVKTDRYFGYDGKYHRCVSPFDY
jgi:hypothetical protein